MSLSATYISELDTATPDGTTEKGSVLDDYIRKVFSVLQNQFPNLTAAAVTGTTDDLNEVTGANAAGGIVFESRIGAASGVADLDGDTKVPLAQIPDAVQLFAAAGTRMLFQHAASPVGWTAETAISNAALRFVAPSLWVGAGGTAAFTTTFAAARTTGGPSASGDVDPTDPSPGSRATDTHSHNIDLDVLYIDVIVCEKDA